MNIPANLDAVIRAWAESRCLPVYTEHRGEQVRSFQVTGKTGGRCQIWVEVQQDITVHVWDYRRRHEILVADAGRLADQLDAALALARKWAEAG